MGDYVVISAEDTGRGIDPDVLENIFEPFFTTKEVDEGNGMGLSMVHGFINRVAAPRRKACRGREPA